MKIFLTIIFVSIVISAHAQSRGSVTGKVVDQYGIAIPYAAVFLVGTEFGTVTNDQGFYLFKVPAGTYVLKCKSIGFEEEEAKVEVTENETSTVNVGMTEGITELQQLVVTGVKVKSATATRTIMEIQDIPQSIVVLGQKTIEQQAAFDLSTITRNMSGINFTGNYSGAGSYQFFNARGFDLVNSQNYRWNGMMIWNLGNNYADNIEQVEFLKGPASILFGDVAPGGVMNFSTKKPLPDFYLKAELRMGEWNLFRPAIDVSGPLSANKKIRYRLNTSYENTDSFRDQVNSERFMVAPSITWDVNDKLSINTEVVFKKSLATDDAGLVSPDGTVDGLDALDPGLYLGESAMKYEFNDNSYFLNLTYQLNQIWRLKVVGFYGYTKNRPWGLWPDPPDANGDFVRRQYGYHQWLKNGSASADLFGTFFTGKVKHNVLMGVEFQTTNFRYTNEGYLDSLDTNNIYNMTYGQTSLTPPTDEVYLPFISRIKRYGIYFQDQIMLMNEKLHVLLGFRLGNTAQGNDYLEGELTGSDYEGYEDDMVDNTVFTPRIGVVFKPVPSTSLYASFAQGYEVNPPDLFAQNYAEFSTPPATISSQVEFGTKTNFFDEKLGMTFSLFQIDKKDPYGFVYLDPENPNYDEYNVYYEGHHRSRGIEMDIDGNIHPTVSLTLGAAYTKTEVVKDPGYPSGNLLPNAPKITGNIWINYNPLNKLKGLSLGFGAFYKDKFYSGIDNNPDLEIPASYTLDAALGYIYKGIGLQINVSNLTNEVNYSNPWIFNLFEVRPLRRTVVTLTYKFSKKEASVKRQR